MSEDFTTTELLAVVKARANVVPDQTTFSVTDFLRFMRDAMRDEVVPLIISQHNEYLVAVSDVVPVKDQRFYDIPPRAIGAKLRDVTVARVSDGAELRNIPKRELDQLNLGGRSFNGEFFSVEGNRIRFGSTIPDPLNEFIRMRFYRRPNALVQASSCAKITTILDSDSLTVESAPSTIIATTKVDLIKNRPHFDTLGDDVSLSSIVSNTYNFSKALPSELAVGDFVCVAGDSPVVQLPQEFHSLVAQFAVVRLHTAQNDASARKNALQDLRAIAEGVEIVISPRVDGESTKIISESGLWGNTSRGFR